MKHLIKISAKLALLTVLWIVCSSGSASAMITGVTGPTFTFTAQDGYIVTPEGNSIYFWGLANDASPVQYPGPTMIVNQGDTVTVTLVNELHENTSLIFPGQEGVVATGGVTGQVTQDAEADGGTVTYSFIANNPGTFMYQSGTDIRLQVEMGLVGALIVRPATSMQAYDHPDTAYDREVLFMETEMDPIIHELMETDRKELVDFSHYFPVYWFLNGRSAPDTMAMPGVPWLPNQPYNCMPRIHPGETLLLRFIAAGSDLHPFHTHANDFLIIAKDAQLLESAPGNGPDLGYQDFTTTVPNGGTEDALFSWTGERLGWDIYGHAPGDPLEPNEYAPDHGKPIPVALPDYKDMTYGENFSGSPFLGQFGFRPPGVGLDNLYGGFFYMWHSHKEKEMVNNDVFPGGMMTMLIIEHPSVVIDEAP